MPNLTPEQLQASLASIQSDIANFDFTTITDLITLNTLLEDMTQVRATLLTYLIDSNTISLADVKTAITNQALKTSTATPAA